MVNKKGWLRIVEASIAILIIFGVLVSLNNRIIYPQKEDLHSIATTILEEMARNVSMREDIITWGSASAPRVKQFVGTRITQPSLKFDVVICEVNEICSLFEYPTNIVDIYATERIISATLFNYAPKKVKIFLWRETG